MKTKTITLYSYDELSPEAQERAREWYTQYVPDLWECNAECEIDYLVECGAALGITMDPKRCNYNVDLWNMGRCWFVCHGEYQYRTGWRCQLSKITGGKTLEELIVIGQRLQNAQKPAFYGITANLSPAYNGKNQHVSPGVTAPGVAYSEPAYEIRECLRAFTDFCAQRLLESLEYLYSEEAIREDIVCNEYTFDEEGNRED